DRSDTRPITNCCLARAASYNQRLQIDMKQGVLLVNLGTPDTPHPKDVKRYLLEFLTDGRVIDSSWLFRQFLVRGIIVPRRYKESAKQYQGIWKERGSPLKFHTEDLAKNLQDIVGEDVQVEIAMRYQNPSISKGLEKLRDCASITILPLFPQYASATTGSIYEKVMNTVKKWTMFPKMIFIDTFANHPAFIKAMAKNFDPFELSDYDHVLFSYHGLPQRQIAKGDRHGACLKKECCQSWCKNNYGCYSAQCFATTKALVKQLNIKNYTMTFQSRLGKAEWIKPYTSDVIEELAKKGAKKILVATPAFVADCLETIFEIGEEYAELFQSFGGKTLDRVPCLNGSPEWAAEILSQHSLPHFSQALATPDGCKSS
ncbi:MAG: ferrochelatase, partial [Simkaniaceae bacterium]|nr:ferrochelatase [Simkaniaceae bacterium]